MSPSEPTLLIVEDEADIRELLGTELKMEGFHVETAENGRVALDAMERRRFDLVITDLKMPVVGGLAVLAQAKRVNPPIPVIVATGWASAGSADVCRASGAEVVLLKPFDLDEMIGNVKRLLNARSVAPQVS
ncbi:MAG: response regulator [Myxococcota bacterium]